ncbi:MAG: NAD-binding protein [Sulfuricurvum sp.]
MKPTEATLWLFLRKMRAPLIVLNLAHALPVVLLTLVPGVDGEGKPIYLSFFDAMYIVAYTATTIGFGEIPYAFTYEQRAVVLMTIYLTVPAWVYAIGSIIALLQEKTFVNAVRMNAFRRKVRNLQEEFVVICGYTDASRLLINRLNRDNRYRIVVIDKNPDKIEEVESELYLPSIPAIAADASATEVLKAAGIQSEKCRYIVTLFEESQLNLKISVRARVLNKNLRIIARSGIKQSGENLSTIGVDHVIDVFSIMAKRIDFALRSPYLFNLLSWVQGGNLHVSRTDNLPRGNYIVCGRGRIAHAVTGMLEKHAIAYTHIDIMERIQEFSVSEYDFFLEAGVTEAACVIAATNDDAINLSIIAAARAINPSIFTIVRENELNERSLFSNLRADKIFALDQIAALDGYNYIQRPMTFRFIDEVEKLGEEGFARILTTITETLNKRPPLIESVIDEERMYALFRYLQEGTVTLGQILNDPYRNGEDLELTVLGIAQEGGDFILMPPDDVALNPGDRLLFAATNEGLKRFDVIVNHYYELYFVLHGQEASRIYLPWRR